MNRRRFLAAGASAGLVGLAGLAGCSLAVGSVAPPRVPDDLRSAGGWTTVSRTQETVFEQQYAGVTITAESHTVVYEDAALREAVREKTLGRIDRTLSLLSATHVDFSHNVDNLPGIRGQIMSAIEENAREEFATRMRDRGLRHVAQTGTGTLAVDGGQEASLTEFAATHEVGDLTLAVPGDETLTVEGAALDVAGDLAVWHTGDFAVVVGGAYPAENFARSVETELSSAITVSVDIDLGLEPEAYREEVRAMIRGTQ